MTEGIEEETSRKSCQGDQEKYYQLTLQEFQEEKSWKWYQPKNYQKKRVIAPYSHIQVFGSL